MPRLYLKVHGIFRQALSKQELVLKPLDTVAPALPKETTFTGIYSLFSACRSGYFGSGGRIPGQYERNRKDNFNGIPKEVAALRLLS